jgi:hypothetical protein
MQLQQVLATLKGQLGGSSGRKNLRMGLACAGLLLLTSGKPPEGAESWEGWAAAKVEKVGKLLGSADKLMGLALAASALRVGSTGKDPA